MNLVSLLLFVGLQVVVFGPGARFQLEYSKDDFGIRSHGVVEKLGPNRTKFYPLPQSTAAEYAKLRPEDLAANSFTRDHYEREEVIGPYQVENDRIWFGNRYYQGEGMRGVGAFGFFDTLTGKYTLFSPPEVARYESTAILVQQDCVWIALDRFGEDISPDPGGLIRWDRMTRKIQRYALEFVVNGIVPEDESLRLRTRGGYAVFRDGKLRRFLVNGRPITKFPPPPTHN